MRTVSNRELDKYPFAVRPLPPEEGGGYLVEYQDIPGCMSDGETIAEAIANGREALRDCLEVFRESGQNRRSQPLRPHNGVSACLGRSMPSSPAKHNVRASASTAS
ncbi:MAG: type II toxin-antitoxin system HicB family antitoxin [Acidobacteria bacterium]|nr:type II toxin-antitoxin system HicB family antitoxin [Acidobacteriota bacterium]